MHITLYILNYISYAPKYINLCKNIDAARSPEFCVCYSLSQNLTCIFPTSILRKRGYEFGFVSHILLVR